MSLRLRRADIGEFSPLLLSLLHLVGSILTKGNLKLLLRGLLRLVELLVNCIAISTVEIIEMARDTVANKVRELSLKQKELADCQIEWQVR